MTRAAALAISGIASLIGFAAGTQVAHGQAAPFSRKLNHVNMTVREQDG